MSIIIHVLSSSRKIKHSFPDTNTKHAEETLFHRKSPFHFKNTYGGDNLTLQMNAWPCNPGDSVTSRHDCHRRLINQSRSRIIELEVTDDSGGYAVSHGLEEDATGTITYDDGSVTYLIT